MKYFKIVSLLVATSCFTFVAAVFSLIDDGCRNSNCFLYALIFTILAALGVLWLIHLKGYREFESPHGVIPFFVGHLGLFWLFEIYSNMGPGNASGLAFVLPAIWCGLFYSIAVVRLLIGLDNSPVTDSQNDAS